MHRRSTLLAASLLPLLTLACGNVLVEPSGGTGGSTSTGTGSTGTMTTGTGTTTTGTTGSGGSPACGETHDSLSIELSTYDGQFFGCKGGTEGLFEMNATVVDAGESFLALDSCAPNADCLPMVSKLAVSAPGLNLGGTQKGAFVRLELQTYVFMGGCGQKVQITNLPSWAGAPNPAVPEERLWLLATDGDFGTFPDSPLLAETVGLGCYPDDPSNCGDHDDYLWRFRSAQDPADPGVTVAMGETKSWFFQSGAFAHNVLGRNLRAFSAGYCDGPSEYAYWVVHTYGLD